MIDFVKIVLEMQDNYTLEKIIGVIENKYPFQAYLFSSKKTTSKIKIVYSPIPKKVSKFVKQSKAIAGITGGFYELIKNRTPLDCVVIDSKIIKKLTNFRRPCIRIENGVVDIGLPINLDMSGSILQAGPRILINGSIQTDFSDYIENSSEFDSDITADRHPRTIFGINDKNYYFLVVDGRSKKSVGLFLEECSEMVKKLGFKEAINLDGGASSTLVVGNRVINHPRIKLTQKIKLPVFGKERKIPTALIIKIL